MNNEVMNNEVMNNEVMNRVCVIGLGYIGLPTSLLLASKGFDVWGYDLDELVVSSLKEKKCHIVEPGIQELLEETIESGRFKPNSFPSEADIYMICVPTPFKRDSFPPVPNIDYVHAAVDSIKTFLKPGNLLILESTLPVGSTKNIITRLVEDNIEVENVFVAYCPERVLPGNIVNELIENDRIVGGITGDDSKKVADFYREFVTGKVFETDSETAELCKLTENSFRDVNIAFANELSLICEKTGVNVWDVIDLVNKHPRVNVLQPGPGVGGHCIAVDPWFIVDTAPEEALLIRMARQVNDAKPDFVIRKILNEIAYFGKDAKSVTLACFGLSFKANIDDLRESPAMKVVTQLVGTTLKSLLVIEPNISSLPPELLGKVELVDINRALSEADILVLLVDHQEFKYIDSELLQDKTFIDTRGIWHS